jgi:hypothetical protein
MDGAAEAPMSPIEPFDEPTDAECIDGEVVMLGPGTIAASMTPRAAEETARRLRSAARRAGLSAVEQDPAED